MKLILFIILSMYLLIGIDYLFSNKWIKVRCYSVDGDTIYYISDDGNKVKIRLYGIDTPEHYQPYGKEATHFTDSCINGKEVTIQIIGEDKYGRKVGIVYLTRDKIVTLQEELIKSGLCWNYKQYNKLFSHKFDSIEQVNIRLKRGLFSQERPENPASFRHKLKLN